MSLTKTVIIVTLLALLVYTNPTMDDYGEFMHKELIQEIPKEDSLGKVLGSLFGGLSNYLITSTTIRRDFVIFSFYKTDLGDESTKVIGVLNNFIVIRLPESKTDVMKSFELEQNHSQSTTHTGRNIEPAQKKRSEAFTDALNSHEISVCMRAFHIATPGFKDEDLSYLKEWAGHYPTRRFDSSNKLDFFKVPQIKHRLQSMLSKEDFKKLITEYTTESPIELIDNSLFISRCRPHSCPENALIAVSLRDGSIFAMFSVPNHEEPDLYEKRCFAIKNDVELSNIIQERFLNGF